MMFQTAGHAASWSHSVQARSVSSTQFSVSRVHGGGLYFLDNRGTLLVADDSVTIRDRIDTITSTSPLLFAAPFVAGDSDRRLSTLPAAVSAADLVRYDTPQRIRWQNPLTLERSAYFGLGSDAAGTTWVFDAQRYRRFGPDGVLRGGATLESLGMPTVTGNAGDVLGGGMVVVGRVTAPGTSNGDSIVISLDGTGQHRWTWVDPLSGRHERVLRTDRDESLLMVNNSLGLQLALLDPQGQLRWRHRGPAIESARFLPLRDGSVLIHFSNVNARTARLLYLDRDGAVAWEQQRPSPNSGPVLSVQLSAHPQAGVLVAEEFNLQGSTAVVFEQLSLAGQSLWRHIIPDYPRLDFAPVLLPDGQILATRPGGLHSYDLSARNFRPRALQTPLLDTVDLLASAAGSDGSVAVSARHATGDGLTVLDPGGRSILEQNTGQPWRALGLARSGEMCGLRSESEGFTSLCLQLPAGTIAGSARIVIPGLVQLLDYRQLPDGTQLALLQYGPSGSSNQALQSLRVEPGSSQFNQRELGLGSARLGRLSVDGEGVLVTADEFTPQLVRTAADNSVRYRIAVATLGEVLDAGALRDGGTLLRVRKFPMHELLLLDASGSVVARRSVDANAFERLLVAETIDTLVIVGLSADASTTASAPGVPVLGWSRSTGQQRWQVTLAANDRTVAGKQLLQAPDGQHVWFGARLRESYEVQSIDARLGSITQQRVLPASGAGALTALHLSTTGRLARVLKQQDPNSAPTLRVDARDDALPVAATNIGTVARSGAWYDPASSGQGWFLEVIPESRTLYAAWFTFQSATGLPGNHPARLRWYSLQGTYAAGATTMTLDVLENRGGVFAAPPGTAPRKIGEATLRFEVCDRGVLDYTLTEAEGLEVRDRVALQALVVRGGDCGQPVAPATERNGFSSAASGAWYDTATPGQGLVGVVQPPTAQQPGLWFAGWFHYDPAGQADDPLQQSWLTLQGALPATGTPGQAEVEIYRTLGGRLGGPSTGNTTRLGVATVTLVGCSSMRLAWQFDDTELAGAYRKLSGRMDLTRVAACVP